MLDLQASDLREGGENAQPVPVSAVYPGHQRLDHALVSLGSEAPPHEGAERLVIRPTPRPNRLLTVKTGQCPAQRFLQPLSEKMQQGAIDPSFVISHRVTLEEVPTMYERWNNKEDGVIKVAWAP